MDWGGKRKRDAAQRETSSRAERIRRTAKRAESWRYAGEIVASAVLLGCVGLSLFRSRAWPLVNDAALMHYVVFLMHHGMAPYREIGDFNLPGAYAPEWLSGVFAAWLHVTRAAMWRSMDALALLLSGAAMVSIARPFSWFAGVFAGCLFALYHGRDGIGQAGQRDLWMAMLLLWALALLLAALRHATGREQAWRVFGSGILLGAAATIKPFGAGYLMLSFLLVLRPGLLRQRVMFLFSLLAGFAVPLLGAGLFLLHWQALPAFWRVLWTDLPYHAALADGSFCQLLLASSVPSVAELLGLMVAAGIAAGGWRSTWVALRLTSCDHPGWTASPARGLLVISVVLGLASFVAQGKGYPYQRYPYIAFLFLLAGLEFASAMRSRRWLAQLLGAAGFAFGLFVCAPACVHAVRRAQWSTPVVQAMESAITGQGRVAAASLDGQVQCIDTTSGCTDALLALHLRQATGTMYDELLFPQRPAAWGVAYRRPPPGYLPAAVAAGQQRFQAALAVHPPRVFLISKWLFMEGPGNYEKLELWPWFSTYLGQHYTLVSQQDFPRAENGPMGFRMYVRRDTPIR